MKNLEEFLIHIITAGLCFFVPIQGLMLAVGAFIMFDTVTGIWKSFRKGGLKSVTSRKLGQIVPKMILYQLAVITFFVVDDAIVNGIVKNWFSVDYLLTKLTALVLVSIEAKSIDENWKAIHKVGLFSSLKNLLFNIRDLKKTADEIVKPNKENE